MTRTRSALRLGLIALLFGAGCAHRPALPIPTAPPTDGRLSKQVLAFYYGWYGRPQASGAWVHWSGVDETAKRISNSTHYPERGAYDSQDPSLVEGHFRAARDAGITGFIVSWWHQGDFHDRGMPLILDTAQRFNLRITVYFEDVKPRDAPAPDGAIDDVLYLLEHYGRHPAWLKVNGKPVLFVYARAVGQLKLEGWQSVLTAVNQRFSSGALFVGDRISPEAARVFDGVHTYNPTGATAGKSVDDIRAWAHATFPKWIETAGGDRIACVTLIAGYDDSTLGRKPPRPITDRHEGETYRAMWQEAIAANPDWVLICSWNEWHEGSEIEPSAENGERELKTTAEFAPRFLAAPLRARVVSAPDAPDPENWSRFRGPNGSGVSVSSRVPLEFGPERNVVWKTELPFGHSSPNLTRDRIFLTAVRGERLVTICLDRRTGRTRWERDAPRPRVEKLDPRNGPAGPTPVSDGRNVYVFFADFGLLSYDMEGRERWRLPLGPFNNLYGMGASPVLVEGNVVLTCDQNTDSFMIAIGQDDGRVRWKSPRPEAHSGHSTPILYKPSGGPTQIVVPGSFLLTAYAAATGERVWWVRGLSFELKSTPVISGDTLYINGFGSPENQPGAQRTIPPFDEIVTQYGSAGGRLMFASLPKEHARSWIDLDSNGEVSRSEWDYYRAAMASENGMLAIRLGGRGDVTDSNVRWKYHKSVPQLPSPLVYNNVLYMVNDGGIVTALNPETGAEIGQGRLKGAIDRYYASPVAADGKVFMLSERGKVAVLTPGGSLEPVVVNDLGDDIYATPAISEGRIYLRTRGWLYCFGLSIP